MSDLSEARKVLRAAQAHLSHERAMFSHRSLDPAVASRHRQKRNLINSAARLLTDDATTDDTMNALLLIKQAVGNESS